MRVIGQEDFDRALERAGQEEMSDDSLLLYKEYEDRPFAQAIEEAGGSPTERTIHCVGPTERALRKSKWRWYKPLEEHPDLFLEFARLAEKERSPATAREWAQSHGILGCRQMYAAGASGMNVLGLSPYEPVEDFFREVDRAATVLRLYECVLRKDHDAVEEMVNGDGHPFARRWWEAYPEDEDGYGGGVLGFALDTVMEQVNVMKDAFASQGLWRPAGQAQPAKVQERWTFRNLLGAMYLQMYWLLAAGEKNVARCENCGRLISLATRAQSKKDPSKSRKVRSDKRFCSKKCWRQDYYERKEKDRRKAERESSALIRKARRLLPRPPKKG